MGFWIPWGVDAVIAAVVVYFFLVGLADGSVSSFNAGLWTLILLALAAILGGGSWCNATGRRGLGIALLLILALPGALFGLYLAVLVLAAPRWN